MDLSVDISMDISMDLSMDIYIHGNPVNVSYILRQANL